MCKQGDVAVVIIDGADVEVDKCMVRLIDSLNDVKGMKTLGCCCGHGVYEMSVVVVQQGVRDGKPFDVMSGTDIPRKRKFYKKDENGMYYLPEVK